MRSKRKAIEKSECKQQQHRAGKENQSDRKPKKENRKFPWKGVIVEVVSWLGEKPSERN